MYSDSGFQKLTNSQVGSLVLVVRIAAVLFAKPMEHGRG